MSSSGLPLVVTTSLVFSSDDPDFGLGPLDGHSSNSVFRRLAVFGLLSISSVLPSPWVQAQVFALFSLSQETLGLRPGVVDGFLDPRLPAGPVC